MTSPLGDIVTPPTAEDIVVALAKVNPFVSGDGYDSFTECGVCHDYDGDHDESCAWLWASNWVKNG